MLKTPSDYAVQLKAGWPAGTTAETMVKEAAETFPQIGKKFWDAVRAELDKLNSEREA